MIVDETILSPYCKPIKNRTIKYIILHTTENQCVPGVARNVAMYFHGMMPHPASAHYVVGTEICINCVPDNSEAYHCKSPMNEISIGVEMTGYAAFTKEQWASPLVLAMLDRATSLVAYKCSEHNIDAKFINAAGLKAGIGGISFHSEVSKAWHNTDHQDPGPNFPIDFFISEVNRKLLPTSQLIPSP